MKTIITSPKGPPLRRVLCSFLFSAAAFFVVPANSQTSGDIVWVTTGNTIAAYNADGTPLNTFNVITLQPVPIPNTPGWVGLPSLGGILVSGSNLYAAAEWVPNVAILPMLLQPNRPSSFYRYDWRITYAIAAYNAGTGNGISGPGAYTLPYGNFFPLVPAGMALSVTQIPGGTNPVTTYYVANNRAASITKTPLSSFNLSYINSTVYTVIKAPYALAVGGPNGNILYVTNNAQSPKGNFYISTYSTAATSGIHGALLMPYFIENQTGTTGLYGLALQGNTLYVSVYSGSAPGVYTYAADTGNPVNLTGGVVNPTGQLFVSVNKPWGIAIGSPPLNGQHPTLYVASQQDPFAIYEFDATTGYPTGSIQLSGAPTNITVEPAAALGN
jgi:hypothetical protein